MKNRYKLFLVVAPIFNNLLNVLVIKFLSIIMSIGEFGDYNLIKSTVTLLIPIITMGIPQAVIRLMPKDDSEEKETFLKDILLMTMIIYLILSFIATIFIYIFRGFFNLNFINLKFSLIIFLYLFLQSYGLVLISIDRAELKNIKYNLYNLSVSILFGIIFIFTYKLKTNLIILYFIINVLVYFLINFIYLYVYYKNHSITRKIVNLDNIKLSIQYGLPLIGIMLAGTILNVGDRFVINIMSTKEQLGIYTGMYSIANGIWSLIFLPISVYAYPKYMKYYKKGEILKVKQFICRINCVMVTLCLAATLFIFMYHDFVIRLFLSNKFSVGYKYLLMIFLGNLLYGLYYTVSTEFYLENKTRILFILIILSSVLNIILNIILIKFLGVLGAALSTMICYLLLFLITYFKQGLITNIINIKSVGKNLILILLIYGFDMIIKQFISNSFITFFISLSMYLIIFYFNNKEDILLLV